MTDHTKKDTIMRQASPHVQQKIQELILLLRTYPDGLTCEQIKTMLNISGRMFQKILYDLAEYPIGHDARINNKYYWVGL